MSRKLNRVLAIGDIHSPCERRGYLEFTKSIYKKYKCNQVVFIGDIVDNHAISFYTKHPSLPGPEQEYELAYQCVQRWYKAYPRAKVCCGNHDSRIVRVAESVSITAKFLRNYKEVWGTKNWDWNWEHVIDRVCYQHGIAAGGLHPAYNTMKKSAMSMVLGHFHSAAGIKWLVNAYTRLFGLDVGCGIDDQKMAFAYGKHTKIRSVISCGVVIDGHPYLELMPMSKGEKFHDSMFD